MMYVKVVFQLMVFALVFTMFIPHLSLGEKDCYEQKYRFKHKCMESIEIKGPYVAPSDSCVLVVRQSDMACICRVILIEEQAEISVSKIVRLATECGNPVPAGNKCGSYTVPPPLSQTLQMARTCF
ncbi:unnamed protein product [Urochloa decumbens]|uniref:Bifunctional inhibitor/plant lipid transfer protein/seed storage helical domain-containing protein n=1 Tax=Urochloa decumbens TaxID=240449 RepID=A0ABC9EDJ0_9POAL